MRLQERSFCHLKPLRSSIENQKGAIVRFHWRHAVHQHGRQIAQTDLDIQGSLCNLAIMLEKKKTLKGKFPQTILWIGWVESNFRNPTVNFWANLDNPFKSSNYGKFCMSPSLDGTRICDTPREQFSIDFVHRFSQFLFFLGINCPADQVQS